MYKKPFKFYNNRLNDTIYYCVDLLGLVWFIYLNVSRNEFTTTQREGKYPSNAPRAPLEPYNKRVESVIYPTLCGVTYV